MALAIDASTPALATGSTDPVTTASFSPPAGALLLLCAGCDSPSAGVNRDLTSVTTTGLTWTRRALKSISSSSTGGAGTDGTASIWTTVAAGGAITVAASNGFTGAGNEKALKVWVLTGADTVNVTNVAASFSTSGLPSCTLTGCLAGSYVFAQGTDWAQKGLGTAGTGQTLSSGDEYNPTGNYTTHTWRTTNVLASAGSQTMNLTAPAAEQYNMVVIEIRDAGGGGGTTTLIHPKRPSLAPIFRASIF